MSYSLSGPLSDILQKEMYVLAFMMRGIPTSRRIICDNRVRHIHIHTPTGRLMFSLMYWKQAFTRFDILKEIGVMNDKFTTHPTDFDKDYIYAVARISEAFDFAEGAIDGACADLKRSYSELSKNFLSAEAVAAYSDLKSRPEFFKNKIMGQIYGDE